ncbi:hypothetical protein BDV95DRAFT_577908 [Massariosphaeria phaeospora]|uniref:NADH-ubiquinone oxidoreductase 213 kDa subunit n=1 Tax=Massariosphaeria phaeospora TaxID=100035 RepID=A0A7C8I264_9PLEO|nr:hypothetical protein BDV95DRAFT_577908 [Massariosphaeria phaeospora]
MAAPLETYQPHDTLANAASSTLQTTLVGAIIAGVQNTLTKQNVGARGIITRSGGIIALYAAVGATYQITKDSASNLREKDDLYSEAMAGFAGGSVVGIARRSMPMTLGAGVGFAVVMSAFRYTNGISGYRYMDADEDEVERKEALKKLRRRPLQETIEELGEGRGIYAPGWEERRRERLLAKYGIDVAAAQQTK